MAISIYDYVDYLKFIGDKIGELKFAGKYSARSFAKRAGFGSSSYLKMVLDGKRQLSERSLEKLAGAFQLNTRETEYLKLIFRFTTSSVLEEKDAIYQDILEFGIRRNIQILGVDQYQLFAHWYIPVIVEGVGRGFENLSVAALSRHLKVPLPELETALERLIAAGILEMKSGKLQRTAAGFDSPDSVQSLALRRLYREMIFQALESLDRLEKADREYGMLTIALSEKGFEKLRAELLKFRKRVNLLLSDDAKADKIYQLNLNLFKLCDLP